MLGIGTYTMSTLANRLTRAPVDDQASLRLVGRLGFRQEGYAPAMLFIDGAWRDHERWAITREMTDFPPVDPHPTRPAR